MGFLAGIGAAVADVVASVGAAFAGAGSAIAGGLGLDAATGAAIGSGLEGATVGAGLGAAESGITGGNPLTGALTGGITGGTIGGFGSAIGSATGLGTTAGDVIAGTGGGVLGAAATGQPIGTGALQGAAGGLTSGLIGSAFGGGSAGTVTDAPGTTVADAGSATSAASGIAASPVSTPGPSAASVAAPVGAAPTDLTATAGTEIPAGGASALQAQQALSVQGGTSNLGFTTTSGATDGVQPGASTGGAGGDAWDLPSGTTSAGSSGANAQLGIPTPGGAGSIGDGGGSQTFSAPQIGPQIATGGPAPLTGVQSTLNSLNPFTPAYPDASLTDATGNYITPPVPPALDASGNPITVNGAPQYATQADANAAAVQNAGLVNPAAPVPGTSSGGIFSSLGSLASSPAAKALGIGVAGLGVVKDLLAPSAPKGLNAIASEAAAANNQGAILQSYLTSGTLPPAVQASVNAATQAGETAIKSKYAQMGIAPGSSQEVQDIAYLKQNAAVQGATLADQLLQQGISETQLSGTLYNDLVNANVAQNKETTSAISSLAAALAGGGATVKIGGSG